MAILTGTGSTMAAAGNLIEWMAWALLVLTDSFDQPGGMWFNPGAFMRLDRLTSLPNPAAPAPGPPSRPDIPRCGGEWPAALIADEIEVGRLRALVVVGANLATALPDTSRVEAALGSIDTLVVLDTHRNETTDLATHVFACAGQLERPDLLGLELNASAVYQHYTSAVLPAPPSRPPAWRTLCHIGRSLGVDVLGRGEDPSEVSSDAMLERLARGESLQTMRDGDGIRLDAASTFGWVQQRLPRGRWDLAPSMLVEQLRQVAAPPPLALVPRRTAKRMNSQALSGHEPHEALLHPVDAAAAGVADGDEIELQSLVGAVRLAARVTSAIAPGAVSVQHGRSASNVNHLIDRNDLDLLTGMPRMSGTAVTVRRLQQ